MSRAIERNGRSSRELEHMFALLAGAMVFVGGALLAAAATGTLWLTALLCTALTTTNAASTTMVVAEAREHTMRVGPSGICGQVLGAVLAGAAFAAGRPTGAALVGAGLCVQWPQVTSTRRYGMSNIVPTPARLTSLGVPLLRGFTLAACCYGPLGLYGVLVGQLVPPSWVEAAMAVYAAGALFVPWVDARLDRLIRRPSALVLGAVGAGMWALAVSLPLLLAGRFTAGVVLFFAQGRLLGQAAGDVPGQAGVSATILGTAVGNLIAAVLVDRYSIPAMGTALAAVALSVAALSAAAQRLSRRA